MLHRKIEKKISAWIKNSRKALLIDGARQVGKTYIIRSVLEKEECEYIEVNLLKTPALAGLLAKSETVDDMIANLSLFADKPFKKGKTFIFFDEIQEFKELTTKIKFWVDEGSFRYIFSGSLLGVELKNIKSAPVGYLKTYTMYPLDFEEFLQIYNFSEDLRSSLYRSFVERKPVNENSPYQKAVQERTMKFRIQQQNIDEAKRQEELALLEKEFEKGGSAWLLPYGRYASGAQITSLISCVSKWENQCFYNPSRISDIIAAMSALMLSDTKEAMINLDKKHKAPTLSQGRCFSA